MADFVLSLDAGTHAVRGVVFDVDSGASVVGATVEVPLVFAAGGRVEVDPEVLAGAAITVVREASEWARAGGHRIVTLGVTNFRESAFAWRRSTGEPVSPGVMWMSKASQPVVQKWEADGLAPLIRRRTGLTNHTFFFGSKLAWLLGNQPGVAQAALDGDLQVGTVDTWLVHRLTGGSQHVTDTSNASRSQFFNLRELTWDKELMARMGIDEAILPEVRPTFATFGRTRRDIVGEEIEITALMADQQASLLGHGCERPGAAKVTFGTSGVVSINTGTRLLERPGLVTSVAWTTSAGETSYELEGSAFHSGYTMHWLSERMKQPVDLPVGDPDPSVDANSRVYVIPAFSELGAPRWPKQGGAALLGLGMDTTDAEIMRAGLESMAYQAQDLLLASTDMATGVHELSVDGGGASSGYLCQYLADLTGTVIRRPHQRELTSLGVAKAALRGKGIDVGWSFGLDPEGDDVFEPSSMSEYARTGYGRWVELVTAVLGSGPTDSVGGREATP